MAVLEARFRYEGSGWRVRLVDCDTGAQIDERAWSLPDARTKDGLFWSLFDPQRHRDLVGGAHQLRLRPETLPGSIPPAPWSAMEHPHQRCHLLDAGWTLLELCNTPSETRLSGRICVDGDEALHGELRSRLGPRVAEQGEPWQSGDIVVIAGRRSPAEISETQARADDLRVALLGFTCCRPGRAAVPQIHPTGGRPLTSLWLTEFLRRLLRSEEPEWAFARAGSCEPRENHADRWMTGHAGVWVPPPSVYGVPTDWFARLDRSTQERQLRDCIEGLAPAQTGRRVHVVLFCGPKEAGLDLFYDRVLSNAPQSLAIVEGRLAWTEDPMRQEHALWRFAGARSRKELPTQLTARNPQPGRVVLYALGHEICALGGPPDTRRIPIEALQRYLDDLEATSRILAHTPVRLLILVAIQGDAQAILQPLRRSTPTFLAQLLPALGQVPIEELSSWLDNHGLPHEPSFLARLSTMSYNDLLQALATRYPEHL